jgi:hypothetical protein
MVVVFERWHEGDRPGHPTRQAGKAVHEISAVYATMGEFVPEVDNPLLHDACSRERK